MIWNNYPKIVACTSTLVLFSFHPGQRVAGPTDNSFEANGMSKNHDRSAHVATRRSTDNYSSSSGGSLAGYTSSRNASDGSSSGRPAALRPYEPGDPYTIYLTFDDGPSSGSQMVNELTQKDSLQINVFLIGRNVFLTDKNRMLFRNYQLNPLVELGNHSYTHAEHHYEKYFQNPSGVLADFDRNRDSLKLGTRFARLPGRNFFRIDSLSRNDLSNGKEAADTLANSGYELFGWDLEWRRQRSKGFALHTGKEMLEIVAKMLENKKTFIPGHIIILLHDPELRDPHFMSALQDFIEQAKADGKYRFGHLSAYPA